MNIESATNPSTTPRRLRQEVRAGSKTPSAAIVELVIAADPRAGGTGNSILVQSHTYGWLLRRGARSK